jgi:hypothetical protein
MCVVFNDPNSIITVDDAQGPNVYMGERRDNSLVAQTMQEFRNAGAGAGEKVSGVVGRMLEACRFRA